jgi:hypothetical protein
VSSKLIFDFFWLKCANKPLQWVTEKELARYSVCVQIVDGIVRRFGRRFGHV